MDVFFDWTWQLTKIKSYCDEVTEFYSKEFPKVDSNYTWLAVITLDSAPKKDENCYLQVFLKERKYIKKIMIVDINDYLNVFSSSNYSDDSDKD